MKRIIPAAFLLAVIGAGFLWWRITTTPVARAELEAFPETRAELEALADKLAFFATGEFLYDRDEIRQLPNNLVREYHDLLRPVSDGRFPVEACVALLKHPNARVRTLALAALYAREDPKLLPHIASLMGDKAITYSRPAGQTSALFIEPKFDPKMLKEQTVGDVAGHMVGFYLWRVGYDLHERNPTPGEFRSYWETRKDRNHSAKWFTVQLARATRGYSPPSEDRVQRIRAVRKKIDELSPRERAWVLLLLLDEPGNHILVTNDELVAAAKELGPDRLLGLLRRQADTDDPDWGHPQKRGTWPYMLAVRFVLAKSRQLLRPEDGQTLLAYETRERESVSTGNISPIQTAFWAIGAAQLQPDKANKILHEAFARYEARYQKQDRVELALALWRTFGSAETTFLVDWFYKETPGLGEIGFGRTSFLRGLPATPTPDDRKLVTAIVREKRFDTLDWQSLMQVVETVNGWTKNPVVTPEDLRKAWHPYGIGHFTSWQEKAKGQYPKETENLLTTLQSWRTAVRESMPRWEQAPAGKEK